MDLNFTGVALSTEIGNELVEFQGRLYRNEHMSKAAYRSSDGSTLTYYFVCHHNGCSSRIKKIQPCDPMSLLRDQATTAITCCATFARPFHRRGTTFLSSMSWAASGASWRHGFLGPDIGTRSPETTDSLMSPVSR